MTKVLCMTRFLSSRLYSLHREILILYTPFRERNVSYYVEDSDVCSARYTKRQLAEMSIGADGSRTTNPNEECFVEFSE